MWTQQELKERLFQEIICYLDKGKVRSPAAFVARPWRRARPIRSPFLSRSSADVGKGHRAREAARQDAREPHV